MTEKTKHTCSVTKVIMLLSDSWTMLIVQALSEGPKRYSELETWLENISSRTLTLKLKILTEKGLVIKSKDGFYKMTFKGSGLKIIERAMRKYNKAYLESK